MLCTFGVYGCRGSLVVALLAGCRRRWPMAAVARLASSNSDPVAHALYSLFSLLEPAPELLSSRQI